MNLQSKIKIPFSYFGAKRKIAPIIWQALGKIDNYIEPFCGSLSILLRNPNIPKIETVNDIDAMLTNFWRAVAKDPESVAEFADQPVNELDLHARHKWLLNVCTDSFKNEMGTNIDFYDVRAAGYWIWGHCASIGNNWMQSKGLKALPMLSSLGGGIHGNTYNIKDDFKILQQRLRKVRVTCGDWLRIVTPSVTYNSKSLSDKDITGIVLDPPYDLDLRDKVYREDDNIYEKVVDWAIKNGDNPKMRIVLCGYEGDHGLPNSWQTYCWKTDGGLSSLGNGRGKENAKKEVIYFSPFCLKI